MSTLKELLNKHCPDGVEYVELSSVINYEQPSKYIVENTKYNDDYDTPVLTAGQTFILGYTNEKDGIYKASKKEPVIIFDDFTTSFHWVDFNFKVKSSAMKMLKVIDENKSNFRYLYYCMKNIKYVPLDHTRQWIEKYSKFMIPLPPIKMQKEIVRILDEFTDKTTKLQELLHRETILRKKQYEYYKGKLLTFGDEVEKIQLKDLFYTKNGYTPSKSNPEFWDSKDVSWFRMEDIRENGRILNEAIQKVSFSAIKGNVFPKNSIIVSTSATIGEHALITCESLANQRFTYLILKDEYKNKFNIFFLFYYCYKLKEYCLNCLNQGNFASVDMTKFNKFEFPIISLKEQERIVKILDQFDTLCNDITRGLPAEIELRKKQYEYYRDKLLTFKEKKC